MKSTPDRNLTNLTNYPNSTIKYSPYYKEIEPAIFAGLIIGDSVCFTIESQVNVQINLWQPGK